MGEEILGPIGFIAVEWPGGDVPGEGFRLLLDVVERGIIRVLDIAFIAKSADGTARRIAPADVRHGGDVDLTIWDGASSGLLDQSDIDQVVAAVKPDSLAGIVVYENVWAVPMWSALERSTARLIGTGPIQADDLIAALDATEPS